MVRLKCSKLVRLVLCVLGVFGLTAACATRSSGLEAAVKQISEIPSGRQAIVTIGDIHGTREVPEFYATLALELAQSQPSLSIGFELPDDLVQQSCTDNETEHAFWNANDGRGSQAIYEALCAVKSSAVGAGHRVFGTIAYDKRENSAPSHAPAIIKELRHSRVVLLLIGNHHARRTPDTALGFVEGLYPRVISKIFVAESRNYNAWVCIADQPCIERRVGADFCVAPLPEPEEASSVVLRRELLSAYKSGHWDACITFPATTASPPKDNAK